MEKRMHQPLFTTLLIAGVQTVAGALLAVLPMSAQPQTLPLAPAAALAKRAVDDPGANAWQIGPLSLDLPSGWGGSSRSSSQLQGPRDTVATIVVASATAAARSSGYSALADAARGPRSFANHVEWDECQGTPERAVRPLSSPPGSSALYAQCPTASRPGVPATLTQLTLYTRNHLVQIQVLGDREETLHFLEAFHTVRWRD